MKFFITLITLITLHASSFASDGTTNKDKATKWSFDKSHSAVTFQIRHFFTPVNGRFKEFDGNVYFDPNNLDESSIDVTMSVKSIDTENEKRDGHLQSKDFFLSEQFPNIRFVSTEIISKGNNQFVAKGKLTIKDVTKDVELPFTLLGTMEHPRRKGTTIAAFEATTTLNRLDYGVGTGNWAESTVVSDEVEVKVTLEMYSTK